MISKELFLLTLKFIRDLEEKENRFIASLEALSPNTYCDCFLYSEPINKIEDILMEALDDKEELLLYYLYDFRDLPEDAKNQQIKDTPELASDEALYDYLIAKINKEN